MCKKLSKEEFISKLKKAHELEIKKRKLLEEIFQDYSFEHILLEDDSGNNLEDGILCFVNYGDQPMSGSLEEYWNLYSKGLGALEGVRNG